MTARIVVRPATAADDAEILAFLRAHWRADHLFVQHPELFRWQHHDPDRDDGRTFMLAFDAAALPAPALLGVLGYMPFRRFDASANWTALALAVWKVRDDANAPGLGLQLLKALQRQQAPSLIAAIGISAMVRPIYEALGYTVGCMAHHALFPIESADGWRIAQHVPAAARRPLSPDADLVLHPLDHDDLPPAAMRTAIDALGALQTPQKSWRYIDERYRQHPWYRYEIRAVLLGNVLQAVLVWRQVAAAGASVLRIVDCIGRADVLARCGAALRAEIQLAGAEYLDLVEHGVPRAHLRAGGFVATDDFPELILPNYFEPFEARNVRVELAFRMAPGQDDRPLQLFRADSDQDRPNVPAALAHPLGRSR